MSNATIIGFLGRKECGKSTAASGLENQLKHCGFKVARMAFGDSLKEMLVNAGICTRGEVYGKKTVYSRFMLQRIGTEIFRYQVDPDYWVKRMNSRLVAEAPYNDVVIIDDCRFPNEAALITSAGGTLVRVTRDANVADNHVSEMLLDEINADLVINNNESLHELRDKVMALGRQIIAEKAEQEAQAA